ncbi:MAG: TIGR02281 family clan AA aspartic protease [Bradyrhizobiaceae bacterium]|jgi:aspartyl protease family protein|nr:MAG: TIGR02281 family clan AA aspartic protease [Bradyrhizobiaceae bacterium]
MTRVVLLVLVIVATAGAALAYGDPAQITKASTLVTEILRKQMPPMPRIVDIPRGNGGEFALQVSINGIDTPMIIDTGATSVMLSYETAKAIGLPVELLAYNVDVETVSGRTKAARLSLDRVAVGKLTERSVPALVAPRGAMKTNLLGMSFLDRLESWEVRADKLKLRGYP